MVVWTIKELIQILNIISNEQFGFRAKHFSVLRVHHITDLIFPSCLSDSKAKTGVGLDLFNVVKAFDKVWYNGLIYKLYFI